MLMARGYCRVLEGIYNSTIFKLTYLELKNFRIKIFVARKALELEEFKMKMFAIEMA